MALHIRSDHVDTLARKVAQKAGETITQAIGTALAERLARLESVDRNAEDLFLSDIREIASRAIGLRKEKKSANSTTKNI